MRQRHPSNRNLTLIDTQEWLGPPLLEHSGPFIEQYLLQSRATIDHAMRCHSRITAIRCDLRLPVGSSNVESAAITRFASSFKAKIEADQSRKARDGRRSHRTYLGYVWVKEQRASSNPHYHFCLLLNGDAYHHLGKFGQGPNTATRISHAWASALGISEPDSVGLVQFPLNAVYHLDRNSTSCSQVYADLIARVSYFAKAATKTFGDGSHHFGCSRSPRLM